MLRRMLKVRFKTFPKFLILINRNKQQSGESSISQTLSEDKQPQEFVPPTQAVELAMRLKTNQRAWQKMQNGFDQRCKQKLDKAQINPQNQAQLPEKQKQSKYFNFQATDQQIQPQIQVEKANTKPSEYLQHLLMNAKKLIYEQKLEQADKILTQEIDKGVYHSDLFYLYAELKRLQGDYQESEFQFKNCISAKTHSPYAYFGLGLIYAQQSDFNQAIQMFRTFVELIVSSYLQDTVDGRFHLAKSLIAINENLEASIHLTKAIELFKQQQLLGQEKVQQLILLHVLRADVYESLGFDELAVEDYRKVREIDPKFYKEYLIEAEKLEAQGNFIEGERIRNFVRKLFM